MQSDPSITLVIARMLAADAAAVEATSAWRADGIPSILLKGPALTRWLYAPGEPVSYTDADLLVPLHRLEDAERVLERLGFVVQGTHVWPGGRPSHARSWLRADGAAIDLHRTVPGMPWAPPAAVWRVLSRRTEPMALAGAQVAILDEPSRALLVALHANHHENDPPKPMADLGRATERVGQPVWLRARELAAQLDAIESFSRGLRKVPSGAALADRLHLPDADLLDRLGADAGAPLALGFERLAATPGLVAKARLLWDELLPAPDRMTWYDPRARGGSLRLAGAYARRLWRSARFLAPSYRVWRGTRRGGQRP